MERKMAQKTLLQQSIFEVVRLTKQKLEDG
jgi:hypothetical protein